MVDHVVLKFIDHIPEIMNFKYKNSIVTQYIANAKSNTLYIWYVGVDIVGHHHIDMSMCRDDVLRHIFGKEIINNCYSRVIDCTDNISRRIYSNDRLYIIISKDGRRSRAWLVDLPEFPGLN